MQKLSFIKPYSSDACKWIHPCFLTPEHPCACCWSRHKHKVNTGKRGLCHIELNLLQWLSNISQPETHHNLFRRLHNPMAANTIKNHI